MNWTFVKLVELKLSTVPFWFWISLMSLQDFGTRADPDVSLELYSELYISNSESAKLPLAILLNLIMSSLYCPES